MARKPESKPAEPRTPSDAELTAEKVRAERKAKREAKAAAAEAKAAAKKFGIGRPGDGRKNVFGIAASSSKATAVTRSIISRARGGRGR